MKFFCDRCNAKYSIADEKVRGKIVKVRCKNCGDIVEVRGPDARGGAGASEESGSDERVWHYSVDGETFGPIPETDLREKYRTGEIGAETYVWTDGYDDWKSADEVDPFERAMSASPSSSQRRPGEGADATAEEPGSGDRGAARRPEQREVGGGSRGSGSAAGSDAEAGESRGESDRRERLDRLRDKLKSDESESGDESASREAPDQGRGDRHTGESEEENEEPAEDGGELEPTLDVEVQVDEGAADLGDDEGLEETVDRSFADLEGGDSDGKTASDGGPVSDSEEGAPSVSGGEESDREEVVESVEESVEPGSDEAFAETVDESVDAAPDAASEAAAPPPDESPSEIGARPPEADEGATDALDRADGPGPDGAPSEVVEEARSDVSAEDEPVAQDGTIEDEIADEGGAASVENDIEAAVEDDIDDEGETEEYRVVEEGGGGDEGAVAREPGVVDEERGDEETEEGAVAGEPGVVEEERGDEETEEGAVAGEPDVADEERGDDASVPVGEETSGEDPESPAIDGESEADDGEGVGGEETPDVQRETPGDDAEAPSDSLLLGLDEVEGERRGRTLKVLAGVSLLVAGAVGAWYAVFGFGASEPVVQPDQEEPRTEIDDEEPAFHTYSRDQFEEGQSGIEEPSAPMARNVQSAPSSGDREGGESESTPSGSGSENAEPPDESKSSESEGTSLDRALGSAEPTAEGGSDEIDRREPDETGEPAGADAPSGADDEAMMKAWQELGSESPSVQRPDDSLDEPDQPEESGEASLTAEEIMKGDGIEQVRKSVGVCRQRHKRSGAPLDAKKVYLSLEIQTDGRVSDFSISPSEVENTAFDRCLGTHRTRWTFQSFSGGSKTIKAPFVIR